MTVATLSALLTASVGGTSMVWLRRNNAFWARKQQARIARGSGSAVVALHLGGMTADLVRGGLLTLLGLIVFIPLQEAVLATVTISAGLSRVRGLGRLGRRPRGRLEGRAHDGGRPLVPARRPRRGLRDRGGASMNGPGATPPLPLRVRAAILMRLFAIQGVWNYETMIGNGIAFALEPALKRLPGGRKGEPYRKAMARHSGYFNAHPYLASVAVGALARAELDGVPEAQIERFRVAGRGPSTVGDRLTGPDGSSARLSGLARAHVACWRERYSSELTTCCGPPHSDSTRLDLRARSASALAASQSDRGAGSRSRGGPRHHRPGKVVRGSRRGAAGAVLVTLLHGRLEGWRIATFSLAAFVLYAMVR
jgi:PTS system mannose-specific IID component